MKPSDPPSLIQHPVLYFAPTPAKKPGRVRQRFVTEEKIPGVVSGRSPHRAAFFMPRWPEKQKTHDRLPDHGLLNDSALFYF